MEERRRLDDKNWEKVLNYIEDTKVYRGTLDEKLIGVKSEISELKDKVKTQNGRIGVLETNYAKIAGAVALIGLMIPVVVFVINKLFK